ncbi:hypothetical protein AUG86_02650 [Euryarchaeota archaeon 13_1_20CM_4_64_14]|nr:MAG: hypothetical protein AUG86_02650 [Euryarchaeota archaeon 13_1_20CM_4_64_14]
MNVVVVSPVDGDTFAVAAMSEIVTDVESEAVPPFPSVRVTVAWYEPVWEYACAVGAPEPDELSPKSHAYEYDPSPPELAASKVSVVPGAARLWLTEAVTEGFGLMTTFFESVATPSSRSVTVHVAVNVPVDV